MQQTKTRYVEHIAMCIRNIQSWNKHALYNMEWELWDYRANSWRCPVVRWSDQFLLMTLRVRIGICFPNYVIVWNKFLYRKQSTKHR